MGDDTMLILDYNTMTGSLPTVRAIDRSMPLEWNFPDPYFKDPPYPSNSDYMISVGNGLYKWQKENPKFEIDKVIFNKPATIVLWADRTKTVVKCGKNDVFDPEKGLAMCFAKKALGNKGRYYNVFKRHLPEEYSKVTLYADDQAICVVEPDKE